MIELAGLELLESIGDTVYVADGDVASRREIELGFTEGYHTQPAFAPPVADKGPDRDEEGGDDPAEESSQEVTDA